MYVLHKIEAALAFDELSILEIKDSQLKDERLRGPLNKQIRVLWEEIVSSLGGELAQTIYKSDYYSNLFLANLYVFKSVDKFKGHELPELTMKRYFAKKDLQQYFFNKDIAEVKM
jgi:hypothetical protein